jgi:hypothetical protein
MRIKKNGHEHSLLNAFNHIPEAVKQYKNRVRESTKYRNMSHGSHDILRSLSWARGENWRNNHPKSLNKSHKSKK